MREVRYVFTLTAPAPALAFEAELENHLTAVLESASEFGDGQVFDLGLVKEVVASGDEPVPRPGTGDRR